MSRGRTEEEKRCVAVSVVYLHYRRGKLEKYANANGDFMFFHKVREDERCQFETNEDGFTLERANIFEHPSAQKYLSQSIDELISFGYLV